MKKAIVTGITGQDGAYLASLLLRKGYVVTATHRRSSSPDFWRIEHLGIRHHPNLRLAELDLCDLSSCIRLIEQAEPQELYNLAAQTFIPSSFEQPIATAYTTGLGPLHMLEAIRIVNRDIRFYQASSSEMYGEVQAVPQTEKTPFYPRSPYAVSKMFSHWMTTNYREAYGIFASIAILFNHESPLRGLDFVTRKITDGVAKIKLNRMNVLELGNLNAKRDWGYAPEYVEGAWRMLQADAPGTFVLATNRTETVREFVTMSFRAAGIEVRWVGEGENERGLSAEDGREIVRVNPRFFRPAEVDLLKGDPSKAETELGWVPQTTLEELCFMMVAADLERNQRALMLDGALREDAHLAIRLENRVVHLGGSRELDAATVLMQRP